MEIEFRDCTDVKVIEADHSLQAKIGTGKLDEMLVRKCQQAMNRFQADFVTLAKGHLHELGVVIEQTKSGAINDADSKQAIAEQVMHLKANGGAFGYGLVTRLATLMLNFIEAIDSVDASVIEIVDAHRKTLNVIVLKEIKGNGGSYGRQLEAELKGACDRYLEN